MREITPKVWKIAETRTNDTEIRDWLEYLNGTECLEHITGNDSERLVELAGRRCYKSFKPGLNPNVSKVRKNSEEYHRNTMSARHGSIDEHVSVTFAIEGVSRICCYDKDTDVLTETGWKNWTEVTGDEAFATIDENDNIIYLKAEAFYKMPFAGNMIHFKNTQVDSLVTPNHRVYYKNINTRKYRRNSNQPYEIKTAEELLGQSFKVKKGGLGWDAKDFSIVLPKIAKTKATEEGLVLNSDKLCAFLGWFISEGSLNPTDLSINIAQSKEENLEKIKESICNLLPNTPVRVYRTEKTHEDYMDNHRVTFKSLELYRWLEENVGCSAAEKKVPSVVQNASKASILEFLNAYILGDGNIHKKNKHRVIYTTSKNIADDLQVLILKAGLSANIRTDDRVGIERTLKNGIKFSNKNVCYIVSIQEESRSEPRLTRKQSSLVEYNDLVYCVKVPTGILYVRRNGKPVLSGNTHELCRHRAGTAFSQESLRYVRLNNIEFWIPEVFSQFGEDAAEKSIALTRKTVQFLEGVQSELADIFQIEKIAKFDLKKKLTSAFRRLAPEGLATGIVFTANVRALRHIIEVRTSSHAEEELRLVFGMIADIMIRDYPLLFGDFQKIDTGDGYFEYVPEFSKI